MNAAVNARRLAQAKAEAARLGAGLGSCREIPRPEPALGDSLIPGVSLWLGSSADEQPTEAIDDG